MESIKESLKHDFLNKNVNYDIIVYEITLR